MTNVLPFSTLQAPILVTGAAGFIGRHLVRRLRDLQYEVIGFDLPGAIPPEGWPEGVRVVEGDLVRAEEVSAAMEGVKTVFHLAAVVGDWGNEKLFREVGVQGSRHLFQAAAAEGARVLLTSSIVVYGDKIGKQVCDENTAFGRTFGPYSRTKQAQETLAWEYYRQHDLAMSIVRPSNVYGPGSQPWVHDVLKVLESNTPCLIGGGQYNAGLIYVENLVDALLLAAGPEADGRVYNACDEEEVTWAKYFGDLARIAGTPPPKNISAPLARLSAIGMETAWNMLGRWQRPPLTREALNLAGSRHQISTRRIREELGYRQRRSYEQGIKAVEAYLKEYYTAG